MLLRVPTDLICDSRLSPSAKALYMSLMQIHPCTIRDLAAVSQMTRNTAITHLKKLAEVGWASITGPRNHRRIVPSRPLEIQKALAAQLRDKRPLLNPVGENLSKLVLDVVVDDDCYVDNARPHFLQDRETGEYLELDRWYYARRVGEEYEGYQHQGVTSFANEQKVEEIRLRDARKLAMCEARGIPLVIVTEDDLSFDGILRKIPPQLPQAHFDRDDLYVKTLEDLCEEYVAGCRRARLREARKSDKNKRVERQQTPRESGQERA